MNLASGQVWKTRKGTYIKLAQYYTKETGLCFRAGEICYDNSVGGKNVFNENIEHGLDLVKFIRNESTGW